MNITSQRDRRTSWNAKRLADEKQALGSQGDEVRRRYSEQHSRAELQSELTQFANSRGVQMGAIPQALVGKTLGEQSLEGFEEALAPIVDSLLDDRGDRKWVKEFVGRYSRNLSEAYRHKNGRDLSAEKAYRQVAENVVKLALQEQASTETVLGHHGIEHIVAHNMKVAQRLFQILQEKGCSVTAADRLVLDQAMVDHDIGYALVADEIRQEGLRGQDKGHALIGARLARESREGSLLNEVWSDAEWTGYHRAVLFHGAPEKGPEPFNISPFLSSAEKAHNMEAAVRLADTTHSVDEFKLPPLILDHPQTLETVRLMQSAGELGRGDLAERARGRLEQQLVSREELTDRKRDAFLQAAKQLNGKTAKFLAGRFEGGLAQQERMRGSLLSLQRMENPIGEAVHDFLGVPEEGRQQGKVQEESGAELLPELEFFISEHESAASQPLTPFQAEVKKLVTESPIADYHRADLKLKERGDEDGRLALLENYLNAG